jgi:acetolactate synthase I/II/III large subunit
MSLPSGPVSPYTTTLTNATVAQVLLRYLALEGVHKIFGIPGGGLLNLLVELKNQRETFDYIVCRHETGAAYIADGYHRATGKLGVVTVTSGPGATNALTGVMNADTDGSAILAITGEVAESGFGKGPLQEGVDAGLDINLVFKSAVVYSSEVTDQSECQTLFEQALRDCLSLPRRAAHISLPSNVPAEVVPTIQMPIAPENYRATPGGIQQSQVMAAMEQLLATRRPLLFLGSGCRDALRDEATMAAVTRFVERYAIPVMTTPDAKGIFPEGHALSLRVYGFCSCLWPQQYMQQTGAPYDGLMVIGSSLKGLSSNNFNPILAPTGPFIQVDLEQHAIGRAFAISLGIVGEAGACIRELDALSGQFPPDPQLVAERQAAVASIRSGTPFQYPEQYASDASPIQPAALVRVLQQTLPADAIVLLDAGNAVSWGIHYLEVNPPGQCHSSLAMGPMGFAVGGVVGAKIGRPDKTCVALVGDGAFMMHGAEISTAAAHGAGAIWVVFHDNDLLMVSQGENYFFPDPTVWPHMYRLGTPDLAKFAEGLGADSYTIDSPAQLAALMPQAIAKANQDARPQVIVAEIDRSAVSPYFYPPKS